MMANLSFLLLLVVAPALGAYLSVDPSTGNIVDNFGRTRLFHGVNVVYKIAPFYPILDHFNPELSLCESDMINMTQWGFNVVRLGVMWEAVEPVKGQYNTTYLSIMRGIVDKLGAFGIYTIVDSHQDNMNGLFCGEGFPRWAIEMGSSAPGSKTAFPYPLPINLDVNSEGYPNLTLCQQHLFTKYLYSDAVNAAWASIYSNQTGLVEAFAGYWTAVATAFADSEYVLGYELVNEPWGGNVLKDPSLAGPVGDSRHLQPFYSTLATAIRSVDEDHIILFEPIVNDGWLFTTPGFTAAPQPPKFNNKQALAYHMYCSNVNGSGDVPVGGAAPCDRNVLKYMTDSLAVSRKLGVGAFMTEFGAVGPTAPSMKMMSTMLDSAEEQLQSWAYWTLKPYHDITTINQVSESVFSADGSVQQPKLSVLSRSYAKAVAGASSSIKMKYTAAGAGSPTTFALSYTPLSTTQQSPTLIYINAPQHYPQGFTVDITPPNVATWQFDKATATISVFHPNPPTSGAALSVVVTANK